MRYAYVGSFSYDGEGGIHTCIYDEEKGRLTLVKSEFPEINAGFVRAVGNTLYATDERAGMHRDGPDFGGGQVYIFRIDPKDGSLTKQQEVPTFGVNPSHIAIDSTGKFAVVTHFSVGPLITRTVRKADGSYAGVPQGNDCTTCLYEINPDGTLGRLCDVAWHQDGAGPMSMIHKAYPCPGRNLFAENDLGGDRIYLFSIDAANKKLAYHGSQPAAAHAGPRHGAFHPKLPLLYVNYEQKSAVTCYRLTGDNTLTFAGECELLPEGEEIGRRDNQSELFFHPNGRILYSFFRGKGLLCVLSVEARTGEMKLVQRLRLPGNDPRGAELSPDGRFILVAGHEAGELETLAVGPDGTAACTGEICRLPNPACITFAEK